MEDQWVKVFKIYLQILYSNIRIISFAKISTLTRQNYIWILHTEHRNEIYFTLSTEKFVFKSIFQIRI